MRSSDIVARIGGEEFVACLPGSTLEAAQAVAERVRTTIAASSLQAFEAATTIQITASGGIAEAKGGDETLEQLVHRSDQALYAAKKSGRNCCVCAA